MTEVNSMYHAESRSDGVKTQIDKLESLAHHTVVNPTFDEFDTETEDMLINIYGANHQYVESYKYATVGEAEALVNLPESAQEPSTREVPKKGLQQRRQVLQSILTDLQPLEAKKPTYSREKIVKILLAPASLVKAQPTSTSPLRFTQVPLVAPAPATH